MAASTQLHDIQSRNKGISYASATKTRPTKEDAIVMDYVQEAQLEEYMWSLTELLQDEKKMRYISRISNSRVCCYLQNKQLVTDILSTGKTITIRGQTVNIRPLVSQNRRIIISNARPEIPDEVLEAEFSRVSVRLKSGIMELRASSSDSIFSHIGSFRRQVFIDPDDIDKVPNVVQIRYEGARYFVYFSSKKISCFICHSEGHIAKNCRENQENEPIASPQVNQNSTQVTTIGVEEDFPPFPSPQYLRATIKRIKS